MERTFTGFTAEAFEFFIMIRLNNNKPFFEEHRAQFEDKLKRPLWCLAADMEGFFRELDADIETRPSKCVAHIRRSTRYTRNKLPYRDFLWIGWRDRFLEKQIDKPVFGFYFDMGFEGMSCGAGLRAGNTALLAEFRRRAAAQPERLDEIARGAFDHGFMLSGEDYSPRTLSRPEGMGDAAWELYRKKYFWLELPLPIDERSTSPELVDILTQAFTRLGPLNDFFK